MICHAFYAGVGPLQGSIGFEVHAGKDCNAARDLLILGMECLFGYEKGCAMPSIRRTVKAAFWGVPGPAIVGGMMAFAIGLLAYLYREREHDFESTAAYWPWLGLIPAAEAAMGAVYGLVRGSALALDGQWRQHTNLANAALTGAVVWALVSSPLLALLGSAAIFMLFLGGFEFFLVLSGLCILHLACGAIAGFHVEHYLLHGREPE
jgi:hypothetical protein